VNLNQRITIAACFFLLVNACCLSCKKEYSCEHCYQQAPLDTTINDDSFYTFLTLDGVRIANISGKNNNGLYYGGTNINGYYSGINGAATANNFAASYLEFFKGPLTINGNDTTAQEIAFLAPGSYSYSTNPAILNGVGFVWADANGKIWKTDYGSAEQQGSNFTITDAKLNYLPNGRLVSIAFTAVFNCKLYDDNGNIKLLSNGKLRLLFWI
jgi:hypothetical protein